MFGCFLVHFFLIIGCIGGGGLDSGVFMVVVVVARIVVEVVAVHKNKIKSVEAL